MPASCRALPGSAGLGRALALPGRAWLCLALVARSPTLAHKEKSFRSSIVEDNHLDFASLVSEVSFLGGSVWKEVATHATTYHRIHLMRTYPLHAPDVPSAYLSPLSIVRDCTIIHYTHIIYIIHVRHCLIVFDMILVALCMIVFKLFVGFHFTHF